MPRAPGTRARRRARPRSARPAAVRCAGRPRSGRARLRHHQLVPSFRCEHVRQRVRVGDDGQNTGGRIALQEKPRVRPLLRRLGQALLKREPALLEEGARGAQVRTLLRAIDVEAARVVAGAQAEAGDVDPVVDVVVGAGETERLAPLRSTQGRGARGRGTRRAACTRPHFPVGAAERLLRGGRRRRRRSRTSRPASSAPPSSVRPGRRAAWRRPRRKTLVTPAPAERRSLVSARQAKARAAPRSSAPDRKNAIGAGTHPQNAAATRARPAAERPNPRAGADGKAAPAPPRARPRAAGPAGSATPRAAWPRSSARRSRSPTPAPARAARFRTWTSRSLVADRSRPQRAQADHERCA